MTIEEAISFYEESEKINKELAENCVSAMAKNHNLDNAEKCRQMIEWLRELQKRRERDRWIPTSERLPDKEFEAGLLNGTVFDLFPCLVTRYATHSPVDPKRLYVAKHYYDGNDFVNNAGQERTEAVIAWRPLPEPYEAERKTDK